MDTRPPSADDEWWHDLLLGTHPGYRWGWRTLRHIPSDPRCVICAAPFAGVGAPFMKLIKKSRWAKNPRYCGACFRMMESHPGGAEVEASFLFADVRGSTTLAERMSPSAVRGVMDRFFNEGTRVLVEHDAIVDKFVGDEVIGFFIPALNGDRHAARAVAAGRAMLAVTGHGSGSPWLPIGVGVHTGTAFIGTIGDGAHMEMTALGDPVNVTARLASAAGPGELLVSVPAARQAGLDIEGLERRELELKGKSTATHVVVLGVGPGRR